MFASLRRERINDEADQSDERHPLPYAKPDTQRRFPWWKVSGGVILVAYATALITCYLYANPRSLGGSIYLCTLGFVLVMTCWAGLHFGTQDKDIWT